MIYLDSEVQDLQKRIYELEDSIALRKALVDCYKGKLKEILEEHDEHI